MDDLSPEILLHIFTYLDPLCLVKCREVCKKWKDHIEYVCSLSKKWKAYAISEFNENALVVRKKTYSKLTWFWICKSLKDWELNFNHFRQVEHINFKQKYGDCLSVKNIQQSNILTFSFNQNLMLYNFEERRFIAAKKHNAEFDINDHIIVSQGEVNNLCVRHRNTDNRNATQEVISNVTLYALGRECLYFIKSCSDESNDEICCMQLPTKDFSYLATKICGKVVKVNLHQQRLFVLVSAGKAKWLNIYENHRELNVEKIAEYLPSFECERRFFINGRHLIESNHVQMVIYNETRSVQVQKMHLVSAVTMHGSMLVFGTIWGSLLAYSYWNSQLGTLMWRKDWDYGPEPIIYIEFFESFKDHVETHYMLAASSRRLTVFSKPFI